MPESYERSVHFLPKEEPLRADVSLLGRLVGEVLVEQGGERLFGLVEAIREEAISRRETSDGAAGAPSGRVAGIDPRDAEELARAFSTYFRVVNLAEKIHRIRRRRDYLRVAGPPQGESLEAACRELQRRQWSADQAVELLHRILLEPVFTAHPTESTRRVILEKEQRMARLLVQRMDPTATIPEEQRLIERLRAEITTAWQTEELAEERPTVADEREHTLFFLTDVLYRIVPPLYEALERAIRSVWDPQSGVALPTVVRFASWVGGDMDGNPNVNAHTLEETLEHQHRLVLELYRSEVRALGRRLTQSPRRVGVSNDLLEAVEAFSRTFPEVWEGVSERHRQMPYRTLLHFVSHRLQIDPAEGGYSEPDQLSSDLRLVASSLEANRGERAGLFGVKRLLRRLDTFGFHLATVDVRQDSLVHRRVVGELLQEASWAELSPAARTDRLSRELGGASPRAPAADLTAEISPEAASTLEVFGAIARLRRRFGTDAVGPYIISMTQDVDDVLSVLYLSRCAGLCDEKGGVPLDVAPLFETVPDLEAAPRIVSALSRDPTYRTHLAGRGEQQMVMLGYSDSSKDGGLAASRWALQEAQEKLVAAASETDLHLVFFHGRGGTVGRGGGKTHRAVLATPPGALGGRLRVTEQGEVIDEKYGLRGIAERELERTLGALLIGTAVEERGERSEIPEEWRRAMAMVAASGRRAYRALVYEDSRFMAYFRHATPIDVIERLRIGSRPASRRDAAGIEDLRAIPWVFSWTQSRHLLPGWYGVGTGLNDAVKSFGRETLRRLLQEWRFFRCMIDDVEMALAKADMQIAQLYSQLAPQEARPLFDLIAREHASTVAVLLELKQADGLLSDDPALARSIRLRNPYVDPMSWLQVELLARWREEERDEGPLFVALTATVHGIAQGLQNTG